MKKCSFVKMLICFCFVFFTTGGYAQDGTVEVEKDKTIIKERPESDETVNDETEKKSTKSVESPERNAKVTNTNTEIDKQSNKKTTVESHENSGDTASDEKDVKVVEKAVKKNGAAKVVNKETKETKETKEIKETTQKKHDTESISNNENSIKKAITENGGSESVVFEKNLLPVTIGQYKYKRIPGMKLSFHGNRKEGLSDILAIDEQPLVNNIEGDKNQEQGKNSKKVEIWPILALVGLILVIIILYKFRSKGYNRKVLRSFPK